MSMDMYFCISFFLKRITKCALSLTKDTSLQEYSCMNYIIDMLKYMYGIYKQLLDLVYDCV